MAYLRHSGLQLKKNQQTHKPKETKTTKHPQQKKTKKSTIQKKHHTKKPQTHKTPLFKLYANLMYRIKY